MTETLAHDTALVGAGLDTDYAAAVPVDGPKAIRGIIKRASILSIAAPTGNLASRFLLLIMILTRSQDGGAAMVREKRVGLGGRAFWCLKLRTMLVSAQQYLDDLLTSDPQAAEAWRAHGKVFNDPRTTLSGKFLRKLSLDELPQQINVIRDEMSIVGLRPIQNHECERYQGLFRSSIATWPDTTGLWPGSGGSDPSCDYRRELDATYVHRWTLWSDFVILFRTIPAVLGSKGAV